MHPLRALRMTLGLSQKEMAGKIGMTQPQISNVERGAAGLSGKNKTSIQEAFDLKADWYETIQAPEVETDNPIMQMRLSVGMTQERFAFLTGVNVATIRKAEKGAHLSDRIMKKIEAAVEKKKVQMDKTFPHAVADEG